MIARLFGAVFLVSALAALTGCATAQNVSSVEFRNRPKSEDLICSVDRVTVKVSAGTGLALENSFLTRMESEVADAIYARKRFSPCVIFVPRNFVLDMKITKLTEDGKLAALMSPKIDKIYFDGDLVLSSAPPKSDTIATFSMKDAFAWGCPKEESHFMWGLFDFSAGKGGECGSAASLMAVEDTMAAEIAKLIVVTPIEPLPAPASAADKKDKPGKAGDKPTSK